MLGLVAHDTSQDLVLLPGRFVVERRSTEAEPPDGSWLSVVRAPDGTTVIRPAGPDEADPWAALFSGGSAHAPEATGMLSSLLGPLARAEIPILACSTYTADVVLVPAPRLDEAVEALRAAGHHVTTDPT